MKAKIKDMYKTCDEDQDDDNLNAYKNFYKQDDTPAMKSSPSKSEISRNNQRTY